MRIVHATAQADLERLYRFRYSIYVKQLGWLPANAEQLLHDRYDLHAFNYAAIEEDEVVGSIRVVPDNPHGLPFERCSPLNGYREGKRLVELCRLAVDDQYRGHFLAGLLMKAGCQRALMEQATHVALDAYVGEGSNSHLYEKMGYEPISEPFYDPEWLCELPERVFAVDLEQAVRDWPSTRPGLHRFFTSPDDHIDHG